jgi:hypothetical protein
MTTLTLGHSKRYFGIGDGNDFVVLHGGRCIGRIMVRKHQKAVRGSGPLQTAKKRRQFITKAMQRHAKTRWRRLRRGGWDRPVK